jgi:hypothetical protein
MKKLLEQVNSELPYMFELENIMVGAAGTTLETAEGDYLCYPNAVHVEVLLDTGATRKVDIEDLVLAYRELNPEVVQ